MLAEQKQIGQGRAWLEDNLAEELVAKGKMECIAEDVLDQTKSLRGKQVFNACEHLERWSG